MRIVTLMENTARDQLSCEHGLSLYIETGDYHILFDAGQSGAFADNAKKIGVDLRKVDFAVLSHGHYDHGGGLKRFFEINQTAPVYLHQAAFMPHYNASGKYIGLDQSLRRCDRLIFVDRQLEIADGITLLSCNDQVKEHPFNPFGHSVMENGISVPDDFRHEQYLLIQENGKRICFSGCSHKGILNIAQWFSPDVMVGGFHFIKLNPIGDGRQVLEDAARRLMRYPTVYYTGHCTGQSQFDIMKEIMGDKLQPLSSGVRISL